MKSHPPTTSNNPVIYQYMEETFDYRELKIEDESLKDATCILKEYPRYVDCDKGKLVSGNSV